MCVCVYVYVDAHGLIFINNRKHNTLTRIVMAIIIITTTITTTTIIISVRETNASLTRTRLQSLHVPGYLLQELRQLREMMFRDRLALLGHALDEAPAVGHADLAAVFVHLRRRVERPRPQKSDLIPLSNLDSSECKLSLCIS